MGQLSPFYGILAKIWLYLCYIAVTIGVMKSVSVLALFTSLIAQATLFGSDCEVTCCKAPSVVNYAQPDIPQDLLKPGETVEITLLAAIDENGKLIGTKSISATHPNIEDAVITAVKNWTFEASVEKGEPQRSTINIPFKFTVAAK